MLVNSLKPTAIALAIAFSPLAAATELPPYLVRDLQMMGASVASDGSVSMGAMRLIPFLPPQYDPANVPAGARINDCTLSQDAVSYTCPGSLQFAFMHGEPDEMPHFSDRFTPLRGYQLPPDFSAPAGLVLPAGITLANGAFVPPLTPADMIARMTNAGMFPSGAVTVNPDGTITVNLDGATTTYRSTHVPASGQQGRFMPGMGYGVTVGSDGKVTFPDGTTYVPGVSMMYGGRGMH